MLEAFRNALQSGDLSRLTTILTQDARLYSDGGGKARASMNVIMGGDRVARFFLGVWRKQNGAGFAYLPCWINGQPGYVVMRGDEVMGTLDLRVTADGISGVFWTRNPDKLGGLDLPDGHGA